MGDPGSQKGGLWVVIVVLCGFGGFLLWMIIQKIAGCAPPVSMIRAVGASAVGACLKHFLAVNHRVSNCGRQGVHYDFAVRHQFAIVSKKKQRGTV